MTTVQQRRRKLANLSCAHTMRQIRIARGLSLRTVAARMGISPPYLSDLERGRRAWPEGRVAAFKRALRGGAAAGKRRAAP